MVNPAAALIGPTVTGRPGAPTSIGGGTGLSSRPSTPAEPVHPAGPHRHHEWAFTDPHRDLHRDLHRDVHRRPAGAEAESATGNIGDRFSQGRDESGLRPVSVPADVTARPSNPFMAQQIAQEGMEQEIAAHHFRSVSHAYLAARDSNVQILFGTGTGVDLRV